MAATVKQKALEALAPWEGFRPGLWQKEINVRDFIQQNYTPYEGDASFLAPATPRTQEIWKKLNGAVRRRAQEERARRLADSRIDHRACAGLHRPRQRDHRRAADRGAAEARHHAERRVTGWWPRRSRPTATRPIPTWWRRSRSIARRTTMPCSMRTRRMSGAAAARTSSPDCRMPTDAAGSSAITGACRCTASIGSLNASRKKRAALDDSPSTDDIIRDREELAEQIRSLKELLQMACELWLRHLGSRAFRARRRAVAVLRLSRRREGTEWRGHVAGPRVDVPRHLLRARSASKACSPKNRRRKSSMTSSSSCASCVSCARRNTTSCSRATRPGSPSPSAAWAMTAARW